MHVQERSGPSISGQDQEITSRSFSYGMNNHCTDRLDSRDPLPYRRSLFPARVIQARRSSSRVRYLSLPHTACGTIRYRNRKAQVSPNPFSAAYSTTKHPHYPYTPSSSNNGTPPINTLFPKTSYKRARNSSTTIPFRILKRPLLPSSYHTPKP